MAEDDPTHSGTVPMLAPAGTSEASIGTRRYVARWRDNTVMAEPQDVLALQAIGFSIIEPEQA